jgi:hypothetical protein
MRENEMADKIFAIDETLWASGVSPNWLVAVICNGIYPFRVPLTGAATNFVKTLAMPHIAGVCRCRCGSPTGKDR